MKRTKEHNKKISQAMKGRKLSEEHKKNLSEKMRGNQNARKKVTPSA